jgi:dTDP-4-amino-4,6-dideoxygalactose transaminase
MQKPVREHFLTFSPPYIGEEEVEEVKKVLLSGWLTMGPKVAEFEELFKEYIGCKHAVAVSSCTAALHLSLIICGVKEGDEVITTPFTFAATAEVVLYQRASPVFVDIDPKTFNIDPELVKEKITERTKAIVPVHIFGQPVDLDPLIKIAREHGLHIVEDAAHAIEAKYKGRKIGKVGDATCFSFYVTKNITTAEGGMITTERDDWANLLRVLRLHGISHDAWRRYSENGFYPYDVVMQGYKYNMADIQAAIGISQLKRVEEFLRIRERYWSMYDEAFKQMEEIILPEVNDECLHARHIYAIILRLERLSINRDQFLHKLQRENIGAAIHYPALHLTSLYRSMGYKRGDFPNAEWVSERILSLPLTPKLKEEDIKDVITAVKKIVHQHKRRKPFPLSP